MQISEPDEVLFKQLTLLLRQQRFKRESDDSSFKLFGRKCTEGVERIGIRTMGAGRRNGEFALSVLMGIEFANLESERLWIGMPRTHGSVELRLLNKAAKKEYVCTEDSDVNELARRLVDQIVEASVELRQRSEKIRKAYVSLVEARGSNIKKRLAIFAERKAKELKKRTPTSEKTVLSPTIASVNAFEIASALLRTKQDKLRDLEIHEFEDVDAHDRRLTQRIQQQFVDNAVAIQNELSDILNAPHEIGTVEHKKLPINGVCYFAYWYVGWRILYVVVSHEDIGLPFRFLMGSVARNFP